MNVLNEILTWSRRRPLWQRDALRRLVLTDELHDHDIDELAEICKSTHGIVAKPDIIPLAEIHLQHQGSGAARVNVHSIHHLSGVNALAQNQQLSFGNGLTVVYGENAAGKSGYIRILKSAFRSRGADEMLGNVLSQEGPAQPEFSIQYSIDGGPTQVWKSSNQEQSIVQVSVFDRHSEAVYTTEKTDVAYRPLGLDLFDKLSKACKLIRERLQHEQLLLEEQRLRNFDIPENTEAANLVAGLSPLTDPEEVKALSRLTEDELHRQNIVKQKLSDINAAEPETIEQELRLRGSRLARFTEKLKHINQILSSQSIERTFNAKLLLAHKEQEASSLRQTILQNDLLPGTGADLWHNMWNTARDFSEQSAYQNHQFPHTGDGAQCVLCQQILEADGTVRLRRFEEFVTSTVEKEFYAARSDFNSRYSELKNLVVVDSESDQYLRDLGIVDEVLSDQVRSVLSTAEIYRINIVDFLENENKPLPDELDFAGVIEKVRLLSDMQIERANSLKHGVSDVQEEALSAELAELNARQILGEHEELLIQEVDRLRRKAAYSLCVDETDTRGITQKSTSVTKVAVTQRLKDAFKDEVTKLKFNTADVVLKEVGGQAGKLYHQLVLSRAPDVDMPRVLSEGEARCLSIAAFFAELATSDDGSAVLFDDPVSSFDHNWRRAVAQRLVMEAKIRQVIVFTHDIVFLIRLQEFARDIGVEIKEQYIRQLPIGAGVCGSELPWIAMGVKRRVRHLKDWWQRIDKEFRTGSVEKYNHDAIVLYGYLREAWERGLEEVLLAGVVLRFRESVQTQQIGKIADINVDDCRTVEAAMSKASMWLPGHDLAAVESVPRPDELKEDIEALELWVKGIEKRRR